MGRGLRSWGYRIEVLLIRLCYMPILRYSSCVDLRLIFERLLHELVR